MAARVLTAALLVAATVCAVSLLELGARSWASRAGDPLDRSLFVLQSDRFLGWRQRPGLDLEFMGAAVRTDRGGLRLAPRARAGGRPLIVVLGPSSAFGWGLPAEESYPQRLQELLAASPVLASAAVVNAAQIGYSSYQGLLFYDSEIRPRFRPDFVVIAYGANDIDRHRFFDNRARPDSQVLGRRPQKGLAAALERAAGGLLLPHLVRRKLLAGLPPRRGPAAGTRRVSDDEYAANLRRLAEAARSSGARPVFVNTPDCFRRGNAGPAAFDPAGEIRSLNDIMAHVGRRERIPLLDAAAILARRPVDRMFIDPVHFSGEGSALIAEGLAKILWRNRKR